VALINEKAMDANRVSRYNRNRIGKYFRERIKRFILLAIAGLLGLLFMPSAIKSVSKNKPQADVNSSIKEKVAK
jgi:hypothetical protein